MDIPLVAGTVSTVAFAVSNLPMLRKALRTRDVSSYSLSSMAMINAANAVYSLYVFSLPLGPIWALHTFYVVSCAIMLVLCLRDRLLRERLGAARRTASTPSIDAEQRMPRGTATGHPLARIQLEIVASSAGAPRWARSRSATSIASPAGASDSRSGRATRR